MESSNTKDRIAELRKERTAALGKIRRARNTRDELVARIYNLTGEVMRAERELESMGAKVRRR